MARLTTAGTAIANNHLLSLAMESSSRFWCVLESAADFATSNDREGSTILIFIVMFSLALARGRLIDRSRTHQKANQIVELGRGKPLTIVSWHQREWIVGDARQPRAFEHMKRAVERLKLHRKIVLVADEAGEFLAVLRDDNCGASARIEIVVGIGDRTQDLGWFARPGVVREIRSEEASCS